MSATHPASPHSLAAARERDRLERRVRRATVAIASLRQLENKDRRQPGGHRHLRRAIADFEAQVEAMTARLRDLAPGDESANGQRRGG